MPKIIKVDDAQKVQRTPGSPAYRVMLVTEETTDAKELNMIMSVTPQTNRRAEDRTITENVNPFFSYYKGRGKPS